MSAFIPSEQYTQVIIVVGPGDFDQCFDYNGGDGSYKSIGAKGKSIFIRNCSGHLRKHPSIRPTLRPSTLPSVVRTKLRPTQNAALCYRPFAPVYVDQKEAPMK